MSTRVEILVVAMAAAIVGVWYWTTHSDHLYDDSPDYIINANSLAEGRGFTASVSSATPAPWRFESRPASWKLDLPGDIETTRTPGYPLFLAAMRLIGFTPNGVTLVQHFIRAAMIVLLLLFAMSAGISRPARLIAAAWLIPERWSLWAANRIVTETLFTIVIVAILLLCVQRKPRLVPIAILVGIAPLIRPVGIVFFVVVVFYMALRDRRKAAVLALLSVVIPLLWAWRNEHRADVFTISTMTAIDRLFYRAARSAAVEMPGDVESNVLRLHDRFHAEADGPGTAGERVARYNALANRTLRAHVGGFFKNFALDIRSQLFPVNRCNTCGTLRNRAKDVLLAFYVAFFFIAAIGAFAIDRRIAILLILTVAYFIVVPAGGGGTWTRFRIPAEPAYALLAGCGVAAIAKKYTSGAWSASPR